LERHEFAILGPAVNLAACLMACDKNPGALVDKTVECSQIKYSSSPCLG
jgi:hypothetical protein